MIEDPSARPRREPWYLNAFHEEYLDVYPHRDLSEAARAVRFLSQALKLGPYVRLLDLCCGPGRHLAFFRGLVGRAVGLDLSKELLGRAREHWRSVAEAQGDAGSHALLANADMRRIPFAAGTFDRVVNLFTSFGYFEREDDNLDVLREIARLLRPGGLLALDHMNRETLLRDFVPHSERTLKSGRRIVEERSFDELTGRVVKQVTIEPHANAAGDNGEKAVAPHAWRESVRIYEIEELEAMMRRAGLEPIARHGDYDGGAWHANAPRMILIVKN